MPWDNFAHLSSLTPASGEIRVSGPGQVLRSVSNADPKRHLPNRLELGAGSAELPAEVKTFASQQAAAVRNYSVDPKFWLPDWVRQHIDQGGKPDGLIQKVIDRVRQNPHEATLLEAQAIFNELGRSAEGTALVRQQVSKEVVQDIARLGRGGQ